MLWVWPSWGSRTPLWPQRPRGSSPSWGSSPRLLHCHSLLGLGAAPAAFSDVGALPSGLGLGSGCGHVLVDLKGAGHTGALGPHRAVPARRALRPWMWLHSHSQADTRRKPCFRDTQPDAHCSCVHKSQDMKAAQISISREMGKDALHMHNATFFSHLKRAK